MIKKRSDSKILTTIEVTIGKKKVVFPFFITMSPGIFPMNDQSTPITRKRIPNVMKSFETPIVTLAPSFQNGHTRGELPFDL